ncbi:MAG: hypothetical protein R3190_14090, partial [Thermoanaerobaculia bacterium]|nr:hypothetical protein [Thermoanaerobaculia bacterium]
MIRRLLLVPLLCAVACGESEELVQTRALLEECRSDKVAAQGAASACEDRYAREVRQWEDMEAVVSEVLPQTLADFREEREEILELVPEEARQEVE